MAVEELLIADRALTEAAVAYELGPILADERMGEELVETLEVYLACGSNMRETARRLHLAHRTVAYRLERVEQLLGGLDRRATARAPGRGAAGLAVTQGGMTKAGSRLPAVAVAAGGSDARRAIGSALVLRRHLLVHFLLDLVRRDAPWPCGPARFRRRSATGRCRCRR